MNLDRDDIERIVSGVVEALEGRGLVAPAVPQPLTAAQVAARIGRSRAWVYDHAAELGVLRLGDGERPRLAFDPQRVDAFLTARTGGVGSNDQEPAPERAPRKRRRKNDKPDVQLLPISDRRVYDEGDLPSRTGRELGAPRPALTKGEVASHG